MTTDHAIALAEILNYQISNLNDDERKNIIDIVADGYCLECGYKETKYRCTCMRDD